MKSIHDFFVLIGICIVAISCTKKEEIFIQHSPIELLALSGTNISSTQIKLEGKIEKPNDEEIIDAGFILFEENIEVNYNPNSANKIIVKEISLGKINNDANHSITYTYTHPQVFSADKQYSFVCYVKTQNGFYKSQEKVFNTIFIESKPSSNLQGTLGELIEIEGNFEQLTDKYFISLNGKADKRLPYTLNAAKNKITLNLPQSGFVHGDVVNIFLMTPYPNMHNHWQSKIGSVKILAKITGVNKYSAAYTEIIQLQGTGLPDRYQSDLKLYIGNHIVEYNYPQFSFAQVPNLKGRSFQFGYHNGRDSVMLPVTLQLEEPNIDALNFATKVHLGQNIFFSNFDFYKHFNNTISKAYLGNIEVPVISTYSSIYIKVPSNIPNGKYPITLVGDAQTITTTKAVEVVKFEWNGINANAFYVGEELKLFGSFIKDQMYTLKLNGSEENHYSTSYDGHITYRLPNNLRAGIYQVRIEAPEGSNSNHSETFEIKPPRIDELLQKKINFEVTKTLLKGKGFSFTYKYYIGNTEIYTSLHFGDTNTEEIELYLPNTIAPGKHKIWIDTGSQIIEAPTLLEIK